MISETIGGKKVDVYPARAPGAPLVCLNTFGHEGEKVWQALGKRESPPCTLAAVSNLAWDHDMAPWDCPPLSRLDTPCTGGADEYLDLLTRKILPMAEEASGGEPAWRGLAGYSLAGLFAVYALCRSDLFSRAASMSGSLWFPGIREYLAAHPPKRRPDRLYFSLGDKEAKTRNAVLKTVQENTEAIQRFYADQGIDSIFVLNPGGHHVDAVGRTADGIEWILKNRG